VCIRVCIREREREREREKSEKDELARWMKEQTRPNREIDGQQYQSERKHTFFINVTVTFFVINNASFGTIWP